MTGKTQTIQPGKDLHEVIVGAFRAKGTTLAAWGAENDVAQIRIRNVTYGLTAGPKGRELLNRIVDAAGRQSVEMLYRARLKSALNGEVA